MLALSVQGILVSEAGYRLQKCLDSFVFAQFALPISREVLQQWGFLEVRSPSFRVYERELLGYRSFERRGGFRADPLGPCLLGDHMDGQFAARRRRWMDPSEEERQHLILCHGFKDFRVVFI